MYDLGSVGRWGCSNFREDEPERGGQGRHAIFGVRYASIRRLAGLRNVREGQGIRRMLLHRQMLGAKESAVILERGWELTGMLSKSMGQKRSVLSLDHVISRKSL